MPVFLRFLMMLALVVWIGGIIFFSALAPNVFAVLPTRQLAGNVVNRMLPILHWMGLVSGLAFVAASMLYSRITTGMAHPFAGRHLLVYLMLALTLVSQFGIMPQMAALRTEMGVVDNLPQNDPRRLEFNRLHIWSSRLEQGVLLIGLAALYALARRLQ